MSGLDNANSDNLNDLEQASQADFRQDDEDKPDSGKAKGPAKGLSSIMNFSFLHLPWVLLTKIQ